MSRLEDIEKSIRRYTNDIVTMKVFNRTLNRELLFVFTSGSSNRVLVYDQFKGLDNVAEINFSARSGKVFITSFVVKMDYQQNGIGKFLLDFALTLGDCLGSEYAYLYANPTDPIKGVSDKGFNYQKEKEVLNTIYERLGFKENLDYKSYLDERLFEQRWLQGEKLKNADKSINDFVKLAVVKLEEKKEKNK